MIAKASTIPHGANAARYSVNKDRADIVKANLLPDDITRSNVRSDDARARCLPRRKSRADLLAET